MEESNSGLIRMKTRCGVLAGRIIKKRRNDDIGCSSGNLVSRSDARTWPVAEMAPKLLPGLPRQADSYTIYWLLAARDSVPTLCDCR